jgi:hypothetical protein
MLHNKYCYTVQPVLRGHILPYKTGDEIFYESTRKR